MLYLFDLPRGELVVLSGAGLQSRPVGHDMPPSVARADIGTQQSQKDVQLHSGEENEVLQGHAAMWRNSFFELNSRQRRPEGREKSPHDAIF